MDESALGGGRSAFDRFRAVVAEVGDAIAPLHSACNEAVRLAVHPRIELRIGEAPLARNERELVRVPLAAANDPIADAHSSVASVRALRHEVGALMCHPRIRA